MAFGQKKPVEPKTTFYIKESQYGGYFGSVGEDKAEIKLLPTGDAVLTIGGKGGKEFKGKLKEGQYGPYHIFVVDGHFWYGNETDTQWGKKYKLKQGPKAEDSDEWKAKQAGKGFNAEGHKAQAQAPAQARMAESDVPPFDMGGEGPAGLAAPKGASPGVALKANSIKGDAPPSAATAAFGGTREAAPSSPRPPKPRGYKAPGQQ